MTVVAFRDGVMASDSAVTTGDEFFCTTQKLFRAKDGSIAGFTGNLSQMGTFKRWFEESYPEVEVPKMGGTWETLIVHPDLSMWWTNGKGLLVEIKGQSMTIGSGGMWAKGALEAGATPAQAVQVAIDYNTACRGPIQIMQLEQPNPRPKKKRAPKGP